MSSRCRAAPVSAANWRPATASTSNRASPRACLVACRRRRLSQRRPTSIGWPTTSTGRKLFSVDRTHPRLCHRDPLAAEEPRVHHAEGQGCGLRPLPRRNRPAPSVNTKNPTSASISSSPTSRRRCISTPPASRSTARPQAGQGRRAAQGKSRRRHPAPDRLATRHALARPDVRQRHLPARSRADGARRRAGPVARAGRFRLRAPEAFDAGAVAQACSAKRPSGAARPCALPIYGSDIDADAVARARQNLAYAGLDDLVTVERADLLTRRTGRQRRAWWPIRPMASGWAARRNWRPSTRGWAMR